MAKAAIQTPAAPAPIGPYTQAIRLGSLLFVSGQTPIEPESGQMASGGIEVETRRVLENVKAILGAAGATLDDVVKTTIFLKDMNQFQAVNTVYASYFKPPYPARSTVEVSRLPRDARVEIECIANV
jgi:2-iminobutanoate/2-iminopropanoate deaminase